MDIKLLGLTKTHEIKKNWRAMSALNILIFCCYFLFMNAGFAQFDGKPIIIKPNDRTIVQRCFIENGDEKRTFCVAVGGPEQIHYAIDLSQGTIINLWKGTFLDATTMWTGRGQKQLAQPLGEKVIKLDSEPSFALLHHKNEAWPILNREAVNYGFKGYTLDSNGRPTFNYEFNGSIISDKITPEINQQGLSRTLTITNKNSDNILWFRLAKGTKIERIKKGLYAIDGENYNVSVLSKKKQKPTVRKVADGFELVIPIAISKNKGQLKYSINW